MAYIISSGVTRNNASIEEYDSMTVLNGGKVYNTTVYYGQLFVSSGGYASHVTLYGFDGRQAGDIYALSGGIIEDVTVERYGDYYVSSGGVASNTTINSMGYFEISPGGIANIIKVNAAGNVYVFSGGTATGIEWTPCEGHVFVDNGAVATFASEYSGVYYGANNQLLSHDVSMEDKEIKSNTEMYVMSGGTATNIVWTPCEGHIYVSGGVVTFASEYSGVYYGSDNQLLSHEVSMNLKEVSKNGEMFVMSDGEANRTSVTSGGSLIVSNGGIVNSTSVRGFYDSYYSSYCCGNLIVSHGGIANSTSVDRGILTVLEGGTVVSTNINSDGNLYVLNGGEADGTRVNTKGNMCVSSGGTADNTTVRANGHFSISSGGTASGIIAESGALFEFAVAPDTYVQGKYNSLLFEMKDAFLSDYTICTSGSLSVFNGGEVNNTTVNAKGHLTISNNGIAKSTTVNGIFTVSSGGTADSAVVNYGGRISVLSGGALDNVIVKGGVVVSSGGVLNSATVNANGNLAISSGGIATEITENGGFVNVADGANVTFLTNTFSSLILGSGRSASLHSGTTAVDMTVESGGKIHVSNGGRVNTATLSSSGLLYVSSGGAANSATIFSGGGLYVLNSGTVDKTTVYGNGVFFVSSGGLALNTKVYAGGSMSVLSGAVLAGKMNFLAGTLLSVEKGAVINFDLTQTTAGAKALLSDWSLIQGKPDYTLTVDGNQETGVYKLAGAADEFDGTITVQNTLGESLGTLAVGEKVTFDEVDYTLNIIDDCLTVTVNDAGSVPSDTDTVAPTDPAGLMTIVDGQNVALLWNESTDDTGVKEYVVNYSLNGETFTVRTTIPHYVLKDADYGTWSWSVQAVDFAGNMSAVTVGDAFTVTSFKPYKVEYSADNFEHAIRFTVTTPTLNAFRMSGGTYQMRVMQEGSSEWLSGDSIVAAELDATPQLIKSDADGNADIFFANPIGTWESGYVAQHVGSIGDWTGTNEYTTLFGKNKLADIIEGSTDANILLMTDDDNGDTLFVDDIYTASPGNIAEKQSRIAQIDEIRAGAGNDIVDMTSQNFEYIGDGLTIRGGEGNDTIWANKGNNWLFGDAGNDRIVGASGNDVIAGGIGNDRMHGGGGKDMFTFCENWGVDNVEQLAGSEVVLWFAEGSQDNWDASKLTYTDGTNSVKVSGVTADLVTLKFGDDGSDDYAALAASGAFFDATTERIFEEEGKGMLASL